MFHLLNLFNTYKTLFSFPVQYGTHSFLTDQGTKHLLEFSSVVHVNIYYLFGMTDLLNNLHLVLIMSSPLVQTK
jgi:hypothetical protein